MSAASRDKTIVAYDSFGVRSAARVWWTLRAMGFTKVFVLDGGLKAWRAECRTVEPGAVVPGAASVSTDFRSGLVRSLDEVSGIVASKVAQIVDARGGARFRAEVPEPRAGLRSGHMPGARNVPFDTLLDADGSMKSVAEMEAIFQAAGVDLGQPIVTTCGSGITASVLALALARLGREDVAVYDGAWTEWGARADTAVVTGA